MSTRRKIAIAIPLCMAILVAAAAVYMRGALRILLGTEELDGIPASVPAPALDPGPAEEGAADWICWRGPEGNGRSLVTGVRTDWTGGLRKVWRVDYLCQGEADAAWSAPVIKGNRLVVPGRNRGKDVVFCLEPNTGDLIWSGSYEAPTGSTHGSGPRATPYIDDDRVYTFGRGGDLACWRLHDGGPVWRRNVKDEGGAEPKWGLSSSPLVLGDLVIVQGGGTCRTIAFDKMSGSVAWKSGSGLAGYAAPALARAGGLQQILIFHGEGLCGLDAADGHELWDTAWKTPSDVNATTPIVEGENVFITSDYGIGGQMLRLGRGAPEVVWRNRVIASHHSDPFVIDGYMYGYSGPSYQNGGDFKCIEFRTGLERWSTNEIGWGTTLLLEGHLLCMDIKGNLFLVEPDPNGFRKIAEFRNALGDIKGPAWTIPVVANGLLFLRYKQTLVCYVMAEE